MRRILSRQDREAFEEHLKPYACKSKDAVRMHRSSAAPYRTEYERDIDRIIHSRAFRRLEYKTQVYVFDIDDHLRTRLTHSLEVSQIADNIAKTLGVNCDLARAIALAHDLGHAPFGHAGETELNRLLGKEVKCCWGFKHSVQGVRIVDKLEKKYSHSGLNLTWDVREGILKHTDLPDVWEGECPEECCRGLKPDINHSVTVEGQIVAAADEIAQRCHDLDDCWELGLTGYTELKKLEIYQAIQRFFLMNDNYNLDTNLREREPKGQKGLFTRCLMRYLISDLIEASSTNLTNNLKAREITEVVVKHSSQVNDFLKEFKERTFTRPILQNPRISRLDESAKAVVRRLFHLYLNHPCQLPESTRLRFYGADSEKTQALVIADYVAGMTDRYALRQFRGTHLLTSQFSERQKSN